MQYSILMVAIYVDLLVSGPDRMLAAWPVCRAGEDKKMDRRIIGISARTAVCRPL